MPNPRSPQSPPRPARAFTLLEVMIATVILGITLSAIFFTFRTGVMAWKSGHIASETYQAAHQTQDIILGDLARCFYIPENLYNMTFNSQIEQIQSYEETVRQAESLKDDEREGLLAGVQNPNLGPENMAIPVNLRFKGDDGGELDEIEFARHQSPWIGRADFTWGIKRVRYFVKEGTLYREEKSPFGLPDGTSVAEFMIQRFSTADDSRSVGNAQHGSSAMTLTEEDLERLGGPPPVVEPLCDGVELFNITYGYFKGLRWVEVPDWDSSSFKYRFPEEDLRNTTSLNDPGMAGVTARGAGGGETVFMPQSRHAGYEQRIAIIDGETIAFEVEQDDLPSYCAIQVGVRDGGESGRLHSFTFFVSLAKAQEKLDASGLVGVAGAGGQEVPEL